jgi:hypothetical protein
MMRSPVAHYTSEYTRFFVHALHRTFPATSCFRTEIWEVRSVLAAMLITYDNVKADQVSVLDAESIGSFLSRMASVKPDWKDFDPEILRALGEHPTKRLLGWEGRTIYVIRGGNGPAAWTHKAAAEDVVAIVGGGRGVQPALVQYEVSNARALIPPGAQRAADFERHVRVVFTFLFHEDLGEGIPQPRTEPGNEGCEIRDLICHNRAQSGFWRDLKDKYGCSEIVIEAKNKDAIDRNDLRQAYCYLKPALGLWGFIVSRSPPAPAMHAYNRTLFQNFAQTRGVTLLSDADLQRMVEIRLRRQDPADHLRQRWSEFLRGI